MKEETFKLTRDNITAETNIAISTGEGLQRIWEYKVPDGETVVYTQEDTLSVYLDNSAGAECDAGSKIDVVITDINRQNTRQLIGEIRYAQVKEFADRDKMLHLDIRAGEEVKAEEGERIIIRGNVNTTLDASDSYFELTSKKLRRTLLKK